MMNKIKCSTSALLACLALVGCQKIDVPDSTNVTVSTNDVANLTGRRATFSGSVNTSATCYFLLSANSSLTDPVTIPASQTTVYGSDSTSSSTGAYYYEAQYDSLTPGNDYYLALCATDGRSAVNGNVITFTTPTYLTIGNVYLSDIDGYSTNTFTPTQSLGSFVLTSWSSRYTIWGSYQNMETTYSDSKYSIAGGDNISLSSDVRVYAYYPYTTEYSDNYIPVKANEALYGTTPTYLYGSSGTVNGNDTEAQITMRYALTKVTLSITNANNDGATLSQVSIEDLDGQNIASTGNMNVFTGDISDLDDYEPHTQTCQQTLTSTAYTMDFMLIPASFEENQVLVKFTVDGKLLELALPGVSWSKGTHYTYQLSVDKDALILGGVRVEQWDSLNGGSIDINQD